MPLKLIDSMRDLALKLHLLANKLWPPSQYPPETQLLCWRRSRELMSELHKQGHPQSMLALARSAFKERRYSDLSPSPWGRLNTPGDLRIAPAHYSVAVFCDLILGGTHLDASAHIIRLTRHKVRDNVGHEFLIFQATSAQGEKLWVRVDRRPDNVYGTSRYKGGIPAKDSVSSLRFEC